MVNRDWGMGIREWGLDDGDASGHDRREWVELRDGAGKLQGKWDPVAGVLEIQRRGVKTRYWLGESRMMGQTKECI